jgi:hypothetical protein
MSTLRSDPSGAANASATVLKIDGLDLLFQQSDIRALESAANVDRNAPRESSVGWTSYMRQRWPVYCLSERLDLLSVAPPSRRTCALLALEGGYVGMMCDDVSIIKLAAGQRHEVPIAMRSAEMPILGLLPSGDRLLCIGDPNRLAAHIERQIRKPSLSEGAQCLA